MQSVIVTGASSGIGRATAVRFGQDGAAVLAVGRDSGVLNEVCAAVEREGGRAVPCVADVTASDAPDAIVRAAIAAFGGLSGVVNAAGIIATGTIESWYPGGKSMEMYQSPLSMSLSLKSIS